MTTKFIPICLNISFLVAGLCVARYLWRPENGKTAKEIIIETRLRARMFEEGQGNFTGCDA